MANRIIEEARCRRFLRRKCRRRIDGHDQVGLQSQQLP
jgi:hypothetical protein